MPVFCLKPTLILKKEMVGPGVGKTPFAAMVKELDSKYKLPKMWKTEREDFKIGDVVLLLSVQVLQDEWPLGCITVTFSGLEGYVRMA